MSTVAHTPRLVKATYTTALGLILSEDHRSRPASMDEVEQTFGQAALDNVMCAAGQWITLRAPRQPVVARTFNVNAVVNRRPVQLGQLVAVGRRAAREAAAVMFPRHRCYVVAA